MHVVRPPAQKRASLHQPVSAKAGCGFMPLTLLVPVWGAEGRSKPHKRNQATENAQAHCLATAESRSIRKGFTVGSAAMACVVLPGFSVFLVYWWKIVFSNEGQGVSLSAALVTVMGACGSPKGVVGTVGV